MVTEPEVGNGGNEPSWTDREVPLLIGMMAIVGAFPGAWTALNPTKTAALVMDAIVTVLLELALLCFWLTVRNGRPQGGSDGR